MNKSPGASSTRQSPFSRRHLLAAASVPLLAALPAPLRAQAWPDRPIRLLVGSSAGGGGDTVARLVATPLSERLGQPVVVENKPGANGNIATEQLAHAPPDGNTLLLIFTGHVINPGLFKRLPFDPIKDFAPIAPLATNQTILVVRTDSPLRSLQDLIAAAKAQPGKLNTGYLQGSTQHLATEMFMRAAGIDVVGVPYRGNGPAMTDLIAGTLDFMFYTLAAIPLIEAGKLRALGITELRRSTLLPDVPTFDESGLPGFAATGFYGLIAPARTPPAVIARLNAEVEAVLRSNETRERLVGLGAEPMVATPEEFSSFIAAQLALWGKVIRDANIEQQ